MLSVLEVTQRVPPTCTRLHVPTLLAFATAVFEPAVVNAFHIDPAITVVTAPSFLAHAVDPVRHGRVAPWIGVVAWHTTSVPTAPTSKSIKSKKR